MSIINNIVAANEWLSNNRRSFTPITIERVVNRIKSGGKLLSIEADSKTTKGSKAGYLTGILYIAPANIGSFNVCAFAKTCIKDCLFNSGRGGFTPSVTEARIIKKLWWLYDPSSFKAQLSKDINSLIKKAKKRNMIPVVRLNGTSDIRIERVFKDILERFKDIQFYDYTKDPTRFERKLPDNYDLTFSYDGVNLDSCKRVLELGGRVAVVFKDSLPDRFLGYPVIDGDTSDLRFLDPGGVIVGLKYKKSTDGSGGLHDDRFIVDHQAFDNVG